MTRLQRLRKDNKHFEFCFNCDRWYDRRDLDQVLPHLFCDKETNLKTGMLVPRYEWTESVCLNTGEVYKNPHPTSNPLLRRTIERCHLRSINLRLKGWYDANKFLGL